MLSVYLLVMGLLLVIWSEQQKHLRAEKVDDRMLPRCVGRRADGNTAADVRGIVSMYRAPRLRGRIAEIHSHRTFLGELRNWEDAASDFVG